MLLSTVFDHSDFCLTEKGEESTNVSADPATSIFHFYNQGIRFLHTLGKVCKSMQCHNPENVIIKNTVMVKTSAIMLL
jgi:superfamily I DNA/RNA helicase